MLYASIKRTQAELRKHDREESSLSHLLSQRDSCLRRLPADRSTWTRGQRRWFEGIEKSIEVATRRQEDAAERIRRREQALKTSIQQEQIHRVDKLETRRRQQARLRSQTANDRQRKTLDST